MCIGNIDQCWEVMQEVWARCDAAGAAKKAAGKGKQRSCAAVMMIHFESSKRRLEEELSTEDILSFSDLLVRILASNKRQRSSGLSETFSSKRRMNWLRRIWIWI